MVRAQISLARSTRKGMVAVWVAVSLTALMTMLALVMDGGLLLAERRHAQATADAAALAAASSIYVNNGSTTGASASALGVASANGYTNDGTTSIVTVNIPPKAGNFANKAGYAEVIVTWNQQRGFSGIFGGGVIPVSARAVARGLAQGSSASFLLLSPNANPALSVTGNASVTAAGSVDINSTGSKSLANTGNITLTATAYDLAAGSPGYSNSGNITMNGTVLNNQSPTADPLSYLPAPNPSSLPTQSSSTERIVGSGTVTLQPGVYVGGISIIGNYSVTLAPGIYYLQGGGLSENGNVSLTGSGVMIYNAPNTSSDTINLAGNVVLNLSPMTSGPYAGITIFQSRTSTAPVSLVGNAGSNVTGTIYAAGAPVYVTGNTNTQIGSQYISSTLDVTGNSNFTVGAPGAPVGQVRDFGLVE